MKPQDIGPQYSSKVRECTNFAVRTIKDVCKNIGPRPSGSEEELKAQQFMAERVGKAADTVETEEFTIHRKGFFAWMRIDAVLLIASVIFAFFKMPLISVILDVVSAFFILMEFLFYKPFLDPLFPAQTSHNVICTRKPVGEVKRKIIFAGHADSSYEWRFTHLANGTVMILVFVYNAVGLIYNLGSNVVEMIVKKYLVAPGFEVNRWWIYINIIFIPAFIMLYMFINYKICVDGANDNLSGCMSAASVVKFMDDNDIRFENTEVVCMFSGSEEAGLRGAKAYVKAHGDDLKKQETLFVALDTFRDLEDMAVYNKDLTGLVHHDMKACKLAKKAAENVGLDLPYSSIYAGASDSAAMTQGGVSSVTLSSMNPGPPKYYHTRDDKAQILRPDAIEKGIATALEMAFIFDEQGLKETYE